MKCKFSHLSSADENDDDDKGDINLPNSRSGSDSESDEAKYSRPNGYFYKKFNP